MDMEWSGFILSPRFWFLITDDWMTQTSRYREDARVSKILVKVQAELYLLLICRHGFPASTLSEVMQGFLSGGRGRGWRNLLGRSPSLHQVSSHHLELANYGKNPRGQFQCFREGHIFLIYQSLVCKSCHLWRWRERQPVTLDSLCNPSQYVSWKSIAWCILLCKDNNICRRQGRSRSLFTWAI